jgi:hypothetical protein
LFGATVSRGAMAKVMGIQPSDARMRMEAFRF